MEKYRFRANSSIEVEARKPLRYEMCSDGIVVLGGSLPGTGFQPYYLDGVTLPEEINGVPVVELRGTFSDREIGYIEAPALKRISICVCQNEWKRQSNERMRCSLPILCGGCQNTVETMKLTFSADKMELDSFSDCTALKEVCFNGEVHDEPDWDYGHFEEGIFRNCHNLQSVSGYFIGWCLSGNTFSGCESLVTVPNIRVKYLGGREFYNCRSLPSIHLHNGLQRIGGSAFEGCASLRDIYIPDTVSQLEDNIFRECIHLESIHLPSDLTEIPAGMFSGCRSLRKVFLADSIVSIEKEAFCNCSALTNPWIPAGLRLIGAKAFWGCTSVGSVYLPETLETIGDEAFGNCPNLTIKGKEGTLAEKYAKENCINFIRV